ncbi:MAG: Enolase [Candidatus Daviesbacteria bacterium GW2011_GWA2_42_7]|uniref:Enolase n=1 Tax=Candidatus Daviesbacteria bacterium GW2011_GWA2_42_7 TaxID=1618425 RepID=A0A0G1BDP6_9BACT|nr:MAG: Enolase [Candidatus Daviesbacteria bacterium GW2011_GWA2_42_7]
MTITNIQLNIIPDSRGEDTLEAEIISGEYRVTASVPSGKSKGKNEAFVLEPKKALEKFTEIKSQLLEKDFSSLEEFDNFLISLDGTPKKENLGGNLILVLSLGFTKLLAKADGLELYEEIAKISGVKAEKLPLCLFNLIEGGVHIHPAPNGAGLPFQEYLYIPQINSPKESLAEVMLVIRSLGEEIHQKYEHLRQGDEGGYTIPSNDPLVGLEFLQGQALLRLARPGLAENYRLGLDVAASTFFHDGLYLVGDKTMGEKVWIVGDDITTTNPESIKIAHEKNAINAVIIKPNQIGSVTETIRAANLAKSFGWKIIVSHRSGETKDTFIADLAVGLGADGLKSGCPLQEARLVKYQRLVEIEEKWHI